MRGARGRGRVANGRVCTCQSHLGEQDEALDYCRRALVWYEKLDDQDGQAGALDSLGYIHHRRGEHAEATACYQRAVRLLRDLGDRYHEADALARLGDAYDASGDTDGARNVWQTALSLHIDLDHADADAVRARLAALDARVPHPTMRGPG